MNLWKEVYASAKGASEQYQRELLHGDQERPVDAATETLKYRLMTFFETVCAYKRSSTTGAAVFVTIDAEKPLGSQFTETCKLAYCVNKSSCFSDYWIPTLGDLQEADRVWNAPRSFGPPSPRSDEDHFSPYSVEEDEGQRA